MKMNLADPRIAEIIGMAGFDCLWLCMEHVPGDWLSLENLIRAAKVFDMDTVVRVSKGSYSDLIRPLEADAAGIMVPHMMSAGEAREVAWRTRFHPVGRRPLDGGNADGLYCNIDVKEYVETANRERFVIVQIEDPEPMSELDEIAAVEGIDMLFFGPGDFSQGIGATGQWDDPRIAQAQRLIPKVCARHNKFAGTVGSPESIGELIEMGYRFINLGSDVYSLGQAAQQKIAASDKYLNRSFVSDEIAERT